MNPKILTDVNFIRRRLTEANPYRRRASWSAVADAVGVSTKTLRAWRNGATPSDKNAAKIKKARDKK